jgi:CYTH domain-containing protein
MNKTFRTEFRRLFLLEGLPEGVKPADEHLQIFDNYIENTRLCLRSIRKPHTKEWTYILRQLQPNEDFSKFEIAEIHLNEAEHAVFEIFEGRKVAENERAETNEIRLNRYFFNNLEIDVFLGKEIWGLCLATARFETLEASQMFEKPAFAVLEVTNNEVFIGKNLIGKTFADVRTEFDRICSLTI